MITASVASVRDAILIGVVLAALILLVFLRSVRITLIAAISVPAVLAATILMLYVLNQSLNIMTLGGMAAAVGLIIDDTIVMVEHIMRRLQEENDDAPGSAGGRLAAAHELTRPLAGSSASTIVIFAPLAFLSGVTGAFFKALSLTMAISLFISFFVAWLVVPLLAHRLITAAYAKKHKRGRFGAGFGRGYHALMEKAFDRRLFVLLPVLLLVVAGWLSYRHVGSGFLPPMDEGGFILDYRSPAGDLPHRNGPPPSPGGGHSSVDA